MSATSLYFRDLSRGGSANVFLKSKEDASDLNLTGAGITVITFSAIIITLCGILVEAACRHTLRLCQTSTAVTFRWAMSSRLPARRLSIAASASLSVAPAFLVKINYPAGTSREGVLAKVPSSVRCFWFKEQKKCRERASLLVQMTLILQAEWNSSPLVVSNTFSSPRGSYGFPQIADCENLILWYLHLMSDPINYPHSLVQHCF